MWSSHPLPQSKENWEQLSAVSAVCVKRFLEHIAYVESEKRTKFVFFGYAQLIPRSGLPSTPTLHRTWLAGGCGRVGRVGMVGRVGSVGSSRSGWEGRVGGGLMTSPTRGKTPVRPSDHHNLHTSINTYITRSPILS